jgi:hypothetical protein
MAHHISHIDWSGVWVWIILLWALGVFGAVGDAYRRAVKRRRKAAELRHQRRVELALARSGVTPGKGEKIRRQEVVVVEALPAAVIAAPPGARPVAGVPGKCRHERILPVVTVTGEVVRWVCANYPRCEAEFPADVAIYEPDAP